MKFRELKDKLNAFTEEQLDQPVIVFENDDEMGKEIDFLEEQEEDVYWMDGDCYGFLKETQEWIDENPDEELTIEDFRKIPKGQPTLHITDSL